jgi:DNA-3-methyladenine glycosylase
VIDRSLLEGHAADVAPTLLGWRLVSDRDERAVITLTEVEAYAPEDPASHSHRGPTQRTRSMFEAPGILYVYRSYGIHWCANVTTGPTGVGSAVLLRAGHPVEGRDVMERRRGRSDHLADGPGKLCQAMGIVGSDDGTDLLAGGSLRLEPGSPPPAYRTTPRIGISRAVDLPWRFLADGPYPDAPPCEKPNSDI